MPVAYVDIQDSKTWVNALMLLVAQSEGLPRQQYKILRSGEVRVNGGRIKPSYRLQLDDRIRIPPVTTKAEAPVQFAESTRNFESA